MDDLKQYFKDTANNLIRKRAGEIKLGEKINVIEDNLKNSLKNTSTQFVIIGIPEDIGVRANYGRGGANTAYKPALESFLNLQENDFLKGENILLAGEVFVDDLTKTAQNLNTKTKSELDELRSLVSEIDNRVTKIIKQIVSANKIPIIINGVTYYLLASTSGT